MSFVGTSPTLFFHKKIECFMHFMSENYEQESGF